MNQDEETMLLFVQDTVDDAEGGTRGQEGGGLGVRGRGAAFSVSLVSAELFFTRYHCKLYLF